MTGETRRPTGAKRFLGLGLVAALVLIWVVWWQWDRLVGWVGTAPAEARPAAVDSTLSSDPAGDRGRPGSLDAPERDSGLQAAEDRWSSLMKVAPQWPDDLRDPQSCEGVELALAHVCSGIDEREYMREQRTPGGSCGMLRQVVETLAARPPELSSELKSYETILDNVFHLFRALGRERVDLLRRAVAEEEDVVEPAAMALYRWLISRERCARSGRTSVRLEPLYGYAGFLFQTLGGQAYLRRRSPRVEAMVGFYALLILDQAQDADYNPNGVDPRQEIRRTRELIASQPLVFRDRYLGELDRLERKWETRAER